MNKKQFFTSIVILLFLFIIPLSAQVVLRNGYAAIFRAPGDNYIIKKIIDISSRNGKVDFDDGSSMKFTNIWLINYVNTDWNFPDELQSLSEKKDTIILRNGEMFQDLVNDFSSRRLVYEFRNSNAIHYSKIKRIYIAQKIKFKN